MPLNICKGLRFPEDFMFQVTGEEAEVLRCQTGISKPGRGGRPKPQNLWGE